MKTKGRVLLYTPIDWTRKFAQFPSTRRHIPRLPWPRLWRFNRLVHFMAHLLFATATTMAATPVRAQRAPAEPHVVPASASPMRAGRAADPLITITAKRDTIIAGLEDLVLTLAREGAVQDSLTVTVHLTQEQEWIQILPYTVTFAAGQATAVDNIVLKGSAGNLQSGDVVAAVGAVAGYATDDATATVHVIALGGPAATAFVEQPNYSFTENTADTRATVVARMASGMPRGADVRFTVAAFDGSAGFEDYEQILRPVTLREEDYVELNGRWEARRRIRLRLLDDDVREGVEYLRFLTALSSGDSHGVVIGDSSGAPCPDCIARVEITDDEDIPTGDLRPSEEEIREEDESSSTASAVITNGKSFATDRVVTFTLGGTATEGTDYVVTSGDADEGTPGYQVALPAGSTRAGVTLRAMDDQIDDPGEQIEVSAVLDGSAFGEPAAIRIVNRRLVLPQITLAAERDTIIAGLDELLLTATLEEPAEENLQVTVRLTQEQNWVRNTSYQLNVPAGRRIYELGLHESVFSSAVTESGTLTATVDSVSGYDTGEAAATVHVVSQPGPAIKVSFSHEIYRFAEDRADPFVILVAQAAVGMPRAAAINVAVSSKRGTAQSPADYAPMSASITLPEEDFAFENGLWQTQYQLPLTLIDDDVREGTESFDLLLERAPSTPAEVQLSDYLGAPCQGDCLAPVEITDGEDIPELGLSVSEDEIREEGETSSMAIVSITNGKTFAADQAVTFKLGGDAIPGHDYHVAPADADETTADHQVTLPAGSNSVEVTFTALDDEREESTEEIRIRVSHDGNSMASGVIRIKDRFPGPRVEITFEGVRPPQDPYTAGIAAGPFTARITFSERVEGFTREDIEWATHAETTVDSTNIGVFMWDYTEVRRGLEYTARMMPEQSGRLWIQVSPGAATSVATGDGNQLGANSVWVELPEGRMMVAPTELSVVEGDAEGHGFMVALASRPTGAVTVTLSGTDGTTLKTTSVADLTFAGPFWTLGRVVNVTAGADANTADETLTLRLTASGGGYDGQSANVVVTVRDTGARASTASDSGGEDESGLLFLLQGVTPEASAAALFGEEGLSDAQLEALDRLGNGNGIYDLCDLLSWLARCRRGEARCGGTSLPAGESTSGAGAILTAAGRGGRTRSRRRGRAGSAGRRRARNRRLRCRRAPARHGLALLLLSTLAWGCVGDEIVQPPIGEPDPGFVTAQFVMPPSNRDIGAMMVIEGPAIGSVRAQSLELLQSGASSPTRRQVVVSGALSAGPVLEFEVPDRGDLARYQVRFLQVAGEDYTLRDLTAYRVVISR